MDDGRVDADGDSVMQCDRADHDGTGTNPHPITKPRTAFRGMADSDLLVDPAVAADFLSVDDACQSVLDEQCRSDPVRLQGQRRSGAIHPAQQDTECQWSA
jgi:hypothetical protein